MFLHHGAPLENPRVRRMFHAGLAVRADGEVTLTVGRQWAYVRCEGVARFADALSVAEGRLTLRLRGEALVVCRAPAVAFGPDGRVCVWPAPEEPPVQLGRAAHAQLAELLVDTAQGPALPLGDDTIEVRVLARSPGPADPLASCLRE